ncbi:WD40-repeat-containing domain protein [Suillus americanus]|nr:WD40-repeat-containing domain protein [Suillus americanus]
MAARFFGRGARKEVSTPAQSKRPTPKHKFEGHEQGIWGSIFLHDNVHIVSGSVDGNMRKWNCDTGLVVGEPWKGEGGGIYALALSPDGKIIACGRGDGSVQRWTTDGEMIGGAWRGHSEWVRSLSWSPSGSQIASVTEDGTILIRRADNGQVEVGPINAYHGWVLALAYSPSGDRIASGRSNSTICIWNTKTGELAVGPITSLGNYVTSLVWSSDSTKLYSACDRFARVFDSKSGALLHSFEHRNVLWSVALSPKHNVLACVGFQGVVQLWDSESHQQLGQPFHQEPHERLLCVSFSRDGRYVACGGDDNKLTLWMVKDIAPQLLAPTSLQQGDRRKTQQETRSDSLSSSCLNADATGSGGFIEEAHDDPYTNFFQSSQQSLPSPPPDSHLPSLFSARRFWKGISRRRSPQDESVAKERSKRGLFGRPVRSNSSTELATMTPNQPEPEKGVGEGEGEQGENVDHHASVNDSLSARKDKSKGKQRDDPLADVQGPQSYDRTPSVYLDGKNLTFGSLYASTQLANAPKSGIPRDPWRWNSSLFPAGSSRRPVNVATCRDEDRYGIAPESDAEAAAAMLRTNDNVADSSTRPGQPAVVAQVCQGRPIQTQASTNGPEEIGVSCCGFFFGCRRLSNSHQP